jgi:hypothetical protein
VSITNAPSGAPRAVSRRALTAGAAWITPVVVVGVAAPAFAASAPCVGSFRLNWGTTAYTKNNVNSGTATVGATAGTAPPVVVSFASAVTGSVTRDAENLTVPGTLNIGGLGFFERGLTLVHSDPITGGRTNRQTVTITFSRPVTGLAFTITDIDSSGGNWWDRIELSGVRTATPASEVDGTGVFNDPWRFDDDDTNVGNTSSRGNVGVSYAAPVSTITLDYWSTVGGGNQRIFLSDFTFTAPC